MPIAMHNYLQFSTTITPADYDHLQEIKKELNAKSISEVMRTLIHEHPKNNRHLNFGEKN